MQFLKFCKFDLKRQKEGRYPQNDFGGMKTQDATLSWVFQTLNWWWKIQFGQN